MTIEPKLMTQGHLESIKKDHAAGYRLPEAVGFLLAHIAALEAYIAAMHSALDGPTISPGRKPEEPTS